MEQYFRWYTLQLKAWVKRKTSWIMTLGILVIIVLISQIQLPDAQNTKVGICISSDAYGDRFLESLHSINSVFEFIPYGDSEDLKQDVIKGNLECGFVLSEDFEASIRDNDLENKISYICTPLTTKGAVIKETVYAAFLQIYGENILIDSEEEIFGYSDQELTKTLQEHYQFYLDNSRLLQVETVMVDIESSDAAFDVENYEVFPIQGITGVLLFLVVWFECGKKFEKSGSSVYTALNVKQRSIYEFSGYLASITIPAFMSLIAVLILAANRSVFAEILSMVVFVLFCSLWVLFVGKFFKKSTTFAAWALTFVLVQLLLCPVFIDIAEYFPAIGIIRWLLPINWYL